MLQAPLLSGRGDHGTEFFKKITGACFNSSSSALSWPTRAAADALLDQRLAQPNASDANDLIYMYEASRDYDPEPLLGRIRARVLAINSADDERNPPSLGVMERELPRINNARLFLIPASPETAGHGTTAQAKWWKQALLEELARTPRLNK